MSEPNGRSAAQEGLASAESEAVLEAVAEAEASGAAVAPLPATPAPGSDAEAAGPPDAASGATRHRRRAAPAVPVMEDAAEAPSTVPSMPLPDAAGTVRAGRIEIGQGGIGQAEADEITIRMGGIGMARADHVVFEMGGVGAALADHVEVQRCFTLLVAARGPVRFEQAGAMTVFAQEVEMGPQSGAVFVVARTVRGQVRALFDWRAGLAFGAAFAVVSTLLRGAGRRRSS